MPDTAMSPKTPASGRNAFRFAEAVYLPSSGRISGRTGTVRLEPKLARLLDLFIQSGGTPLSREDILDEVWPDNGSDEALTQAVSRLRRHLGRSAIKTLPRFGYSLSETPQPAEIEPEEPADRAEPVRLRMRWPFKSMLVFSAGLVSGLVLAVILAPILFVKQIEVEEMAGAPGGETRLIRTSSECSLLTEECVPDDGF